MLLSPLRFSLWFALFLPVVGLTGQAWAVAPPPLGAIAQARPSAPIAQPLPQPITLYQPLQQLLWEGEAIDYQGIAYFPLPGSPNPARTELDLEMARVGKNPRQIAQALAGLALARQLDRRLDQAIRYYTEGLQILATYADPSLEAMVRGNLVLARLQAGDYSADTIEALVTYIGLTQKSF